MENINVNKHLFEEKNSDLTFKNRLTKTNKLESAIIYSFFIFAYYEIFLRSILLPLLLKKLSRYFLPWITLPL